MCLSISFFLFTCLLAWFSIVQVCPEPKEFVLGVYGTCFLVSCASSFPECKLWIGNMFWVWEGGSNLASSETAMCNSSSVTLVRIFHFQLHLSGVSQTTFQCLVSLELLSSYIKIIRLWDYFSLCKYSLMSIRDFWSQLQHVQNLLDVEFGGWIHQSSYSAFWWNPIQLCFSSHPPSSFAGVPSQMSETDVVCSSQRLLLFDVMRTVGLVSQGSMFTA